MLSQRTRRILLATVAEFIATGEPVSSKVLVQRRVLDLSSASVRAVLAELEASGLLVKPHTSAGRVPTERAFEYFAEAMVNASSLASGGDPAELDRRYAELDPGLDALLKRTAHVLAELTGSAALVRPPRGEAWVLKDLRFISLRPGELLAVIVATNGAVENRVLRADETLGPAEVDRINNVLRPLIEGRTLAEVRARLAKDLETARAQSDRFTRRALQIGSEALASVDSEVEVLVEGAAQLLDRPEFASVDRTRALVRTLDDQELLLRILDRTLSTPGITVLIGNEENEIGRDLSLVSANFGQGAVGVIGSTRMDYSQVVPLVRDVARRLARRMRATN
jgi:heat-inducible transcriptional repressor